MVSLVNRPMDTCHPHGAHRVTAEENTFLARIIADELGQPVPPETLRLATAIRQRHGAAVAAILFYGSCLRTGAVEGAVLDFYVLVDSYRAAYSSWGLRWANVLLPPNVFYLEVQDGRTIIRAKYAVISSDDFARAATPRSIPAIIWARFCQPARLVYARDERARAVVVRSLAESTITMVFRALVLLPLSGQSWRFQPETLWQRGFCETYRTEFRAERPETIRKLYQAAPDRYDRIAHDVLRELGRRGILRVHSGGGGLFVTMTASQHRRRRLGWKIRRPLAKVLYAARLLKSAATFTDWLPYVLWKLERHTGTHIEPSERQRRHPFILGGLLIIRLLLKRDFH